MNAPVELAPSRKRPEPQASPSCADRFRDYLQLGKVRVCPMVLCVTAAGFLLASPSAFDWETFLACLLGTAGLTCGAAALNQYLERRIDSQMPRTSRRPLPAGRVRPAEALAFGLATGLGGVALLAILVGGLAALVGALTLLSYAFVYTPLKRHTPHALLVGALPGAAPPLIGWAAADGRLPLGAWILFAILFAWQMPHFLAIAWLYRADYSAAGLPTFASADPHGRRTARWMLGTTLILIAVSLAPAALPEARGLLYPAVAATLGLTFLVSSWKFHLRPGDRTARSAMRASLLYLPALFGMLLLDRLVA